MARFLEELFPYQLIWIGSEAHSLLLGERGSWLRHYATTRQVMGSNPDVTALLSIYIILPAALRPWG
jgi:hypothetical protein